MACGVTFLAAESVLSHVTAWLVSAVLSLTALCHAQLRGHVNLTPSDSPLLELQQEALFYIAENMLCGKTCRCTQLL